MSRRGRLQRVTVVLLVLALGLAAASSLRSSRPRAREAGGSPGRASARAERPRAISHDATRRTKAERVERASPAAPGSGRIFGTISDEAGAPAAGVEVDAAFGAALAGVLLAAPKTARSGADGSYEIAGLPAGPLSIEVHAPALVDPPRLHLELAEGAALRQDFRLARGESFSGRVQDRAGAPIAGIEVGASFPRKSAASGEDGRFTIAGLTPADEWNLDARDPRRRCAPWWGRGREGVVITLEEGARLDGRVVRRGTKEPVAGVTVRISRLLPGGEESTAPAVTDERGRFSFPCEEAGPVVIDATLAGMAPARAIVDLTPGMTAALTLEIGPGGAIEGRVVTPEGEPVAGALVAEASAVAHDALQWGGAEIFLEEEAKPDVDASEVRDMGIETTDADGRFRLASVPPGARRVSAAAPGRVAASAAVEVPADGARAEVTLVLGAGGAIEGLVRTKPGDPAPDGQVSVTGLDGFQRGAPVAADGSFRADGLRAGSYVLRHSTDLPLDGAPGSRVVAVLDGRTTRCDLEYGAGAVVRGTVRAGGAPLAASILWLRRPGFGFEGRARSDIEPGGAYRFEGIAPGRYDFFVCEAQAIRTLDVPPGVAEVVCDLDLPALRIEGRVVDAEGRPVAGAAVRAVRAEVEQDAILGETGAHAKSDASGAFAIAGLDGAAYFVAAAIGDARARAGPVAAGGREPLVLELVRGGTLRVRLRGPGGEAVVAAMAAAFDAAGRKVSWYELVGGQHGDVSTAPLADLAPGEYAIVAESMDDLFVRRTGVRFEGGDAVIDLAVSAGGALEVAARDRSAMRPLEGARLAVAFADGAALPSGLATFYTRLTGPDGIARRERLAAGAYRGEVVTEDGRTARFEFAIKEGETTRVSVEVP